MKICFDASSLAKRYNKESGRECVEALLAGSDEIVLAPHCSIEILSGLCRIKREFRISDADYVVLKHSLLSDLKDVTILGFSESVLEKTVEMLERHPLRAGDALHVAVALEAQVDFFVSSDRRQLLAARAAGLKTEAIEVF